MKKSITLIALFLCTVVCGLSQAEITPAAPKTGYYGRITGGLLAGENSSLSFHVANGVRFGRTGIGLGIGVENYYHDAYYNNRYAPLFLESRFHFGRGATQPFVGITAGYMASLNQYYHSKGGYTAGINIGVTHYYTAHFGMTTSIGYRYVYVDETQPYYIFEGDGYNVHTIREIQRVEIRVGIVFR